MSKEVFKGNICRGSYGADGYGYLFVPEDAKKPALFFVQLFNLAMCVARQAKGKKIEFYSAVPKPEVKIGEHKVKGCTILDESDLGTFTHMCDHAQKLKEKKK